MAYCFDSGFSVSLNLLMSGLGAFVHSARLQYVEFFNKFYEDGGKSLNLLVIKPNTSK